MAQRNECGKIDGKNIPGNLPALEILVKSKARSLPIEVLQFGRFRLINLQLALMALGMPGLTQFPGGETKYVDMFAIGK